MNVSSPPLWVTSAGALQRIAALPASVLTGHWPPAPSTPRLLDVSSLLGPFPQGYRERERERERHGWEDDIDERVM